ncbi:extracellular protein [Desulfacinum hydrothermale DSM 13146]|uniref:Extracellular protein n=1 Tax=Desulfacinum hydrothermale DSM 13146 TaxID=1121390 RepID=A0A1W1X8U4_9BACT|nr:endo alpha-1,4 polygalactosaminidase [Desulfacinum hydrothermale]SMC20098.1 extracellular protein [Desulfacinum hydrothermale DSM 13146]
MTDTGMIQRVFAGWAVGGPNGPTRRLWMGTKGVLVMAMVCLSALSGCTLHKTPLPSTWLCYYGSQWGPDVYGQFDLVVLDGIHPPPLPDKKTKAGTPILLGYVSLGEIGDYSPWWQEAKQCACIVGYNDQWQSHVVDVRNPCWQDLFLHKMVPAVLSKGFDGLFVDTIDSSLALLQGDDPERFQGTDRAVLQIMARLRQEHPRAFIAVNRGLPLLARMASMIDGVVAEDLYSYYAGPEKGYTRVPREWQNQMLRWIAEARRVNPGLLVLTLDYADEDQPELIQEAIRFSKKRGFIPYVGPILLDKIYFHTLR